MESYQIIEKQFKDLSRESIFNLGITVGLVEKDNIYEWKFTMLGPSDTPYKGGLFNLKIKFPKDFPLHAPSINFVTPIYHVNVNSDPETGLPLGFVGFDTLYNWKKETEVREILTKLYALFYWPNPDSSFSLKKANEFKNDYYLYEGKVEYYCKKYASPLKLKENYTSLVWKFDDSIKAKITPIKSKIEHIILLLNENKNFKSTINIKDYNKEKNDEQKLNYLRKQILKYFNKYLNLNLTGKEKKIDLSHKNIGNDELNLFCQIDFNNLEELNLSHNKIISINPLNNFKRLKNIDLSYNKIENDFYGLSGLLQSNTFLEKVNLNNNK
jgi:ubiquitin-conjugating enzyme E2 D/E